MSEEFGKIIRAARALLGWHQTDLAEKSKVSTPTIWAIETGRTVGRGKKGGRVPNELTIDALKATLTSAKAVIIDDDDWFGVKVRKAKNADNAGTMPGGSGPDPLEPGAPGPDGVGEPPDGGHVREGDAGAGGRNT